MSTLQDAACPEVNVTPILSIPYFNDLIDSQLEPEPDYQEIHTFSACGLEFLVASTRCRYPLATCVTILSQLAYSQSTIRDLGEHGRATLLCDLDCEGQVTTTFMLLPETRLENHLQFVIKETSAYVVLPSFLHSMPDETNQYWLRERVIDGILEHMPIERLRPRESDENLTEIV
jgi:hypothetical protein